MAGPLWIRWLLTVAFLAAAGYYIHRLVTARPEYPGRDRAADVAHVVMSTGMAVMTSPIGGPLAPASWLTLFTLLAAGATAHWRASPEAQHLALASIAMVYMLAAGTHDAHQMSGPWTVHSHGLALPEVAWALAAYFAIYAAATANRPARIPRLTLTLGMSYMLVMMT